MCAVLPADPPTRPNWRRRDAPLDSIAMGVQRMSRMLDRVLLLGKADAGMLEFKPQKVELVPLCRQFIDEARAQQPDSRSEVVTEFGDGTSQGL